MTKKSTSCSVCGATLEQITQTGKAVKTLEVPVYPFSSIEFSRT